MNLQLFGYDDGFYYGQCKLICEVETLDGNGKTVTISDGTNNWSATVQNKIAAFLLPPRNKYTVTLINGAKSEYVKDVALGYGECYHLMLADGYDPIMQRDKLSLQEIAASTGNIDGYVPDAAAVKELSGNMGNLQFRNNNGIGEWKEVGADTWNPFSPYDQAVCYGEYVDSFGSKNYNLSYDNNILGLSALKMYAGAQEADMAVGESGTNFAIVSVSGKNAVVNVNNSRTSKKALCSVTAYGKAGNISSYTTQEVTQTFSSATFSVKEYTITFPNLSKILAVQKLNFSASIGTVHAEKLSNSHDCFLISGNTVKIKLYLWSDKTNTVTVTAKAIGIAK